MEASSQTVGEFLEAFFPGRDIAAELERVLRLVESLADRLSAIIERVVISACEQVERFDGSPPRPDYKSISIDRHALTEGLRYDCAKSTSVGDLRRGFGARWYLLDVWRRRVDYPALKAAVKSLAKQWSAQRVLVEDAVAGTALVQELRYEISGIIAVKPVGDKASRMAVASAKIEAGQVFLPERADWLPDLEAELFAFPGSRHDDQCDSISQALFDGDRNMAMEITDEVLAIFSQYRTQPPRYW